jgi:hypothetical protein
MCATPHLQMSGEATNELGKDYAIAMAATPNNTSASKHAAAMRAKERRAGNTITNSLLTSDEPQHRSP